MTKRNFRGVLTSIVTAVSLFITTGAVTTLMLAPDAAYAKSDKSKGNGNGKGRGGGNGKAGKGHDGKHSGAKGNSGKGKGKGNSAKHAGKDNGKAKSKAAGSQKGFSFKKKPKDKSHRSAKHKGKSAKGQRTTLASIGQEIKRDVKGLFGKRDGSKSKKRTAKTHKTYRKASVAPIERSLRPISRTAYYGDDYDKKKHSHRYYRDPLVKAITDPDGSDKLRNLNASKAAAPAFRNASPNSNVGKIATYQAAAETYYDLRGDLYEARRELRDLKEGYDGRSSEEIAEDIEALDPADPEYDDKLSDLEDELRDAETYEEARDHLKADLKDLGYQTRDALEDAEAAFFDASKGRTLTKDTLGNFHGYLGLPQPKHRYDGDLKIQPVPYDPDDEYRREFKDVYEKAEYRLRYEEPYSDRKKPRYSYYRDPLVKAITDPYGSDKLRNLNASKAAAPAFRNASPNSNVGKIATYQAAADAYYDLRGDLYDARKELRDLNEGYDGRSSDDIVEDIEALDPADTEYEEKLSGLEDELREAESYEETYDALRGEVKELRVDTLVAQKEAEYAFFEASKGAVLTKQALAQFHSNLDLPTYGR